MKTSSIYCAIFQVTAVAVVALLLIIVADLVFGTHLTGVSDQRLSRSDIVGVTLLVGMMALIFVPLGWGFGTVECDPEGVILRRHRKSKSIGWNQVLTVAQVPCITPPVYRIVFTPEAGERPVFVSVFSWYTLSIGFWSWDFSGFRDYVRLQINRGKLSE